MVSIDKKRNQIADYVMYTESAPKCIENRLIIEADRAMPSFKRAAEFRQASTLVPDRLSTVSTVCKALSSGQRHGRHPTNLFTVTIPKPWLGSPSMTRR